LFWKQKEETTWEREKEAQKGKVAPDGSFVEQRGLQQLQFGVSYWAELTPSTSSLCQFQNPKVFTVLMVITVVWGATDLIRWEYRVLPLRTRVHLDSETSEKKPIIEGVQNELNALGKDGWELVSVQDIRLEDGRLFTVVYLKRQKLWV
jgi:hypothetical protein